MINCARSAIGSGISGCKRYESMLIVMGIALFLLSRPGLAPCMRRFAFGVQLSSRTGLESAMPRHYPCIALAAKIKHEFRLDKKHIHKDAKSH
jgi:hypothetical protein